MIKAYLKGGKYDGEIKQTSQQTYIYLAYGEHPACEFCENIEREIILKYEATGKYLHEHDAWEHRYKHAIIQDGEKGNGKK